MRLRIDAGTLAETRAEKLVGARVWTPPMGNWTGGDCVVTAVAPDPGAPEIAFNVKRLADGNEIGVFAWEVVDVAGGRAWRCRGARAHDSP